MGRGPTLGSGKRRELRAERGEGGGKASKGAGAFATRDARERQMGGDSRCRVAKDTTRRVDVCPSRLCLRRRHAPPPTLPRVVRARGAACPRHPPPHQTPALPAQSRGTPAMAELRCCTWIEIHELQKNKKGLPSEILGGRGQCLARTSRQVL